MKRFLSILCSLAVLSSLFILPGAAALEKEREFSARPLVSAKEIEAVESAMNLRSIGGKVNVSLLYGPDGDACFLLGESENGYIILIRDTYKFLEGGERSPYQGHAASKKYYGGLMYYYVDSSNASKAPSGAQYYDILRKEYSTAMDHISFAALPQAVRAEGCTPSKAAANPVIVLNAYNYIQRKAFGYNNNNTCGAVATGIVLNYLQLNTGIAFVPSDMRAETLVNAPNASSTYTKATKLHNYLVNDCGMGLTVVPADLVDGTRTYIYNKARSTGLTISATILPTMPKIRSNILVDKPVIIATLPGLGSLNNHVMAVYGYRDAGLNGSELLVHTGWYGSPYMIGTTSSYRQAETWISFDYVSYLFTFAY